MAMATSANELADNMYGDSGRLTYSQPEGQPARNLDYRVPRYFGGPQQLQSVYAKDHLHRGIHKRSPINPPGFVLGPSIGALGTKLVALGTAMGLGTFLPPPIGK